MKYGGSYIRVHAGRLQPAKESQLTFETENPSNKIQALAANNFSSSTGNSDNLEESDNNDMVEIYDDSDFGIHNLPKEGNQDMNNINVNQNINESGSYIQTETPIKLLKSNDHIEYCNPDNDTWEKALVIGRAGKATGQNKYWFNIKNLDTRNFYSIDFNKVKN